MVDKWIHEKLKKSIGIERYNHSVGVMNTSIELAAHYGYPIEKAAIAGLLHDCGKLQGQINLLKMAEEFGIILDNVMTRNKELIHGPLGKEIAKREYNINDEEILDAIRFHTTGRKNMGLLEKIIYIGDLIEPGRNFPGVEEIRREAFIDIDNSILLAMDNTIKYIIDRGNLIHLDTVEARNYFLNLKNME